MPLLSTIGAAAAKGFGMLGRVARIDEFFEYVTLMLHGNGTNGAQNNTFLDSSTNNFTITRNGNTTQGAFSPYGDNWSNYFGSGNSLTFSEITQGSTWTIEFWYNINASGNNIVTHRASDAGFWLGIYASDIRYSYSGNDRTFSFTSAVNTWYHLALVNNAGTLTCYINGTQVGTSQTGPSTAYVSKICGYGAGFQFAGYLSNLRITSTAVYTSAFTPPTAPLTAITNTSLLTCQSNRFMDNSSNNFTITRNGDVSVQRFSPFHPTAPYAAGTIGGSGYFDGSGDYLQAGTNSNLALGSGNFTIEGWHYCTGYNGGGGLYSTINTYPSSTGLLFYIDSIGRYTIDVNGTILQPAGAAVLNAWIHWAVVRNGSTLSIYINGTSIGSVSSSTNFTDQYAVIGRTGAGTNSNLFLGYLSNTRMVKGTAVYTANFTPPTVPVTAIANTQFLCDFTNGGIIDNAMMNDLETVGNAQISTSVSKFGGGSIYLDGSGDYLVSPANQNYLFNAGDFTVEGWFNPSTVSPANQYMAAVWGSVGQSDTNSAWQVRLETNTIKAYVVNGTSVTGVGGGGSISTGQWYHFAFVRGGSSLYLFLNGVQVGSTVTYTQTMNSPSSSFFTVGMQLPSGNSPYTGYIDDLRITKGYARYTANFTAPTAPFPLN